MKIKINKEICIGCGACQAIVPNVFEVNNDGYADVIVDVIPEENEEEVADALENCPTNAIIKIEENK